MAAVYADAHMKWGFAACPDEMALEHRVLATLEANGAASTADLERVLAVPRWRLRDLVTPRASTPAGFARPKYVDWADRGRRGFAAIACPHKSCSGFATRAVLLPEVAHLGSAVFGTRRHFVHSTPNPLTASIVFPRDYVETWWSGVRPRPKSGRTVAVPAPAPADTGEFVFQHRHAGRVRRTRRSAGSAA